MPKYDATDNGTVTFVNTFDVHGPLDEFEQVFEDISEFMAAQPGFINYSLSRNVEDERKNQYVNIAQWTDVASWRAAITHPGFGAHASEIRRLSTNVATMYEPRQAFAAA